MRDRFAQAIARPYIWILVLSIGFAVGYLFLFVTMPNMVVLRAWISRLTVTLLGSYIVAVLVDLNFRRRDEERREQIRNTALEEFHKSMNTHIGFLHEMYKASASAPPDPIPESFAETLRDDFYDVVSHLNFAATYPTANLGPNHSWLDQSEERFGELQEDVDAIIEKYGMFLSAEMMQDFRDLSNSNLGDGLVMTGQSPILSGDNIHPSSPLGSEMPNHPLMQSETNIFPLLASEGWDESVEDHIDAVIRVAQYYETTETPDLGTMTTQSRWREDISPNVGSARIPSSHPVMQQSSECPEQSDSSQTEVEDE